jgi:hypothetical protein
MLTTGNVDLNANGVAIINIKALSSANGSWSIDEFGRVTAKALCLEDVCVSRNQLLQILQKNDPLYMVSTSTVGTSGTTTVISGTSTISGGSSATTTDSTTTSSSTNATSTSSSTSTVTDTVAPVITLNGDATTTITTGGTYTEAGATVTDNIDTGLIASVHGTVDTTTVGVYMITYTATDAAGNTALATREVDVIAAP